MDVDEQQLKKVLHQKTERAAQLLHYWIYGGKRAREAIIHVADWNELC